MSNELDMTPYIQAKSDQLNADDLVGGSIRVQVLAVNVNSGEQPVVLKISGGHMPWKPSKTARRVLVSVWGSDASQWVGRWLVLYRDETVKWAGVEVGGIRVAGVSHIDKPVALSLAVSKGKKQTHRVGVISASEQKPQGAATANLDAFLSEAKLTRDDVDRWRLAHTKPRLADLNADQTATFAGWLAGDPKRIEEIRALIPAPEPIDDEGREPGEEG